MKQKIIYAEGTEGFCFFDRKTEAHLPPQMTWQKCRMKDQKNECICIWFYVPWVGNALMMLRPERRLPGVSYLYFLKLDCAPASFSGPLFASLFFGPG